MLTITKNLYGFGKNLRISQKSKNKAHQIATEG